MRFWRRLHSWTSLLCTGFILVMAVTGLPLIFRDEISDWLYARPAVVQGSDAGRIDLDVLIDRARGPTGLYPGQTVRWISLEDDRPEIWIGLAPSYGADRRLDHSVKFDAHSGRVLDSIPPSRLGIAKVLGAVLKLHQDLLLGASGEMLMMAVAILFVMAIVSGVVIYAPFLRSPGFGVVRRDRHARIRWLDIHNLTGIATGMWMLVVGMSGLLNEASGLTYEHWKAGAMTAAQAPWRGRAMPDHLISAQRVLEVAARAMPGLTIRSIRFPDEKLGSPQHFLVWAIGDTPLTSRLFQPLLIDARSGAPMPVKPAPLYLQMIQLSRPLHFGDYGGLPLKILWALLDGVTILLLWSGLYLWLARQRRQRAEVAPADLPPQPELAE